MAQDRINVNVSFFSVDHTLEDPDSIHPVGVSHLREYFDVMMGEGVPHERVARWHSDRVLDSMATLSTDDGLIEVFNRDPFAYIPYWLRLVTPVVDSTEGLGKYTNHLLGQAESGADLTNDLTYSFGLFTLSSFVIAQQLEIEHPFYEGNEALIERSRSITPPDLTFAQEMNTGALELLLQLPVISASHRRQIERLRGQGTMIIGATTEYRERLKDLLGNS